MPDLITTAKGIAGGLPLAAVTGRAEIMDAVHTGGLGGTYGGNPVACAAALGAIETMQAEDLTGAAKRIEQAMRVRLEALAGKYDVIGDVRGRGAMLAVELVEPGTKDAERRPDRHDRRGLPPAGADHADGRHVRQRAALPAAAGDRRGPAARGPGHPRGRPSPSTPEASAPQRGDVPRVGAATSADDRDRGQHRAHVGCGPGRRDRRRRARRSRPARYGCAATRSDAAPGSRSRQSPGSSSACAMWVGCAQFTPKWSGAAAASTVRDRVGERRAVRQPAVGLDGEARCATGTPADRAARTMPIASPGSVSV